MKREKKKKMEENKVEEMKSLIELSLVSTGKKYQKEGKGKKTK